MLIYLDTNIVIYTVDNPAILGSKAGARLKAAEAAGAPLAALAPPRSRLGAGGLSGLRLASRAVYSRLAH
ncbi:MAG: hypothetical protein ACP5XB_07595 [Isosphaeraceae bacterium]